MRIALVGLNFAEIGARLALSLARRHDVEVYLGQNASDRELTEALRRELKAAARVHCLPPPHRRRMLSQGWRLAQDVAKFAPDVVHVQEAAGWTVWAFSQFFRSPSAFVLTVHDPQPHSGDAAARVRTRWADNRNRRRADAIIVHGEALAREMERIEPSVRGRVHVVPHGALGERVGALKGEGRFLMFGRVQAYKGLGVLLDAVEILAAQNRRFEMTVAGVGDHLDQHRARIARWPQVRLDERYIPADEVAGLFEACDAVTMPYLDATQSGVGALAMMAGRAVIASDVGAIGEVVRDGENGLIVPAGDAPRLAAAMARILDEPGLAARLGAGARATALGELSWERVAEKTVLVYEDARGFRKRSRRIRTGP